MDNLQKRKAETGTARGERANKRSKVRLSWSGETSTGTSLPGLIRGDSGHEQSVDNTLSVRVGNNGESLKRVSPKPIRWPLASNLGMQVSGLHVTCTKKANAP